MNKTEKRAVKEPNSFVYSLDQVNQAVDFIYPLFEKNAVITFTGSLGAGKTTLIQALLRRAGVSGPIQSPTFNYVNRYVIRQNSSKNLFIYHFDLYRLHTLEDFSQAGFDEYLYQPNSKSFIEWPAIIIPLLKREVCHVALDYEGLEMRRISYQENLVEVTAEAL